MSHIVVITTLAHPLEVTEKCPYKENQWILIIRGAHGERVYSDDLRKCALNAVPLSCRSCTSIVPP